MNRTQEVALELSEQGLIFYDPEQNQWVLREEYLSGNVKQKLKKALKTNDLPDWIQKTIPRNVQELEAVQPLPCLPNANPQVKTACAEALGKEPNPEILDNTFAVGLGTAWIKPKFIRQFVTELLQAKEHEIEVDYDSTTNTWNIEAWWNVKNGTNSTAVWGTKEISAVGIIQNALNSKEIRVYKTVGEKEVIDQEATAIANQKRTEIAEKFKEWVWQDTDRAIELCLEYNDRFNCFTDRIYDGSHLTFPGSNPKIKLRPHQVNAIWRILQSKTTLLPHKVGWGKTFIMVASAMELRRMKLVKKPMIVALNSTVEQIASNFRKLYPSAKILVADKKSFEKCQRQAFAAKIATQDWDCVIIAHSQFFFLKVSKETEKSFLEEELKELEKASRQTQCRELRKVIERRKQGVKKQIAEVTNSNRKDETIDWEKLGVDALFIDEAHFFKNLGYVTRMRNVAGLSNSNAQRSVDTLMKVRQTLDKGGRVVFATGTPVSNSVAELFTMQRYLDHELLEELGLANFDAWAAQFGETVTAPEISPTGQYKTKTRFSKFCNLPELMRLYCRFADFPKGKVDLGEPELIQVEVACPPTPHQEMLLTQLAYRAQRVHSKQVEPEVDNMLKITNDGRKGALDIRLVNDSAPNFAYTKVNRCGWNVWQIWKATKSSKATQLIFCDFSTPNKERHNVYHYLQDLLIALGVPSQEIAIIHDYNEKTRERLFTDVRSGEVRILLGSTEKLGTGVDIPDRIIAEHHLDAPWRPADIEQRSGRTKRQGNQWERAWSFRYVTEGNNKQAGFDAFLWQTLETKARFIAQVSSGESQNREAEDVDEVVLNYSIVKAIASGNPIALEKAKLDAEYASLKIKAKAWEQEQSQLVWKQRLLESEIKLVIPSAIERIKQDLENSQKIKELVVIRNGIPIGGVMLERAIKEAKRAEDLLETLVGTINEFSIWVRHHWKKPIIIVKGQHFYEVEEVNSNGIKEFFEDGIERALKKKIESIENAQKELETIERNLNKEFELSDRLKEVKQRIIEIEIQLAKTEQNSYQEKIDTSTKCSEYCPPEPEIIQALARDKSQPDWLTEIKEMMPKQESNIIEFPIAKKAEELHLVRVEFEFIEVITRKGEKANYTQGSLF